MIRPKLPRVGHLNYGSRVMTTPVRWLLALDEEAAAGKEGAFSTRASRTVIAAVRMATLLIFATIVVMLLLAVT